MQKSGHVSVRVRFTVPGASAGLQNAPLQASRLHAEAPSEGHVVREWLATGSQQICEPQKAPKGLPGVRLTPPYPSPQVRQVHQAKSASPPSPLASSPVRQVRQQSASSPPAAVEDLATLRGECNNIVFAT
eukprot:gene10923-biopygen774